MAANLETIIQERIHTLNEEQRRAVLEFIEGIEQHQRDKTLWEKLDDQLSRLSPEVLEQLPSDASSNFDHYLYGASKKSE